MYSNNYYCDSVEYVRSNLGKNQIIEYVELNKEELPEAIYEDDPKRTWEIWKVVRGYKLYSTDSLIKYKANYLDGVEYALEGRVRLYRTIDKPVGYKRVVAVEKPTVPFEGEKCAAIQK